MYDYHENSGAEFYSAEKARGTELVYVNDTSHVHAKREEEKRIATGSLDGCTGAGLALELSNGERIGRVVHYDDHFLEEGLQKLHDELGTDTKSHPVVSVKGVVMVPAYYDGGPPVNPEQSQRALNTIRASLGELGAEADIQLYPYAMSSTAEGAGTLLVEFEPDKPTSVLAEYTTIFPASSPIPH